MPDNPAKARALPIRILLGVAWVVGLAATVLLSTISAVSGDQKTEPPGTPQRLPRDEYRP